jgi:hypothetical protein
MAEDSDETHSEKLLYVYYQSLCSVYIASRWKASEPMQRLPISGTTRRVQRCISRRIGLYKVFTINHAYYRYCRGINPVRIRHPCISMPKLSNNRRAVIAVNIWV